MSELCVGLCFTKRGVIALKKAYGKFLDCKIPTKNLRTKIFSKVFSDLSPFWGDF